MLANLFSLMDGDPGIFQTVNKVKDAVNYSLREPNQRIRRRAESILRVSDTGEGQSENEIRDVYQWVKDHFHYLKDPRGLEYVKSPEVIDEEISRQGFFYGDCDDVSGYLAALLKSIGYAVQLVIISPATTPNNNFTHIFTRVFLTRPVPTWITVDGCARQKYFGWEAPSKRQSAFNV